MDDPTRHRPPRRPHRRSWTGRRGRPVGDGTWSAGVLVRRSTVLPIAIVATAVSLATPATALAGTGAVAGSAVQVEPDHAAGSVTVTGSGFGHGVGMSQYGALGMARSGASVAGILTHYYSGTTVTSYPDDVDLRVNVVDRGSQVTLTGTPLQAGGGTLRLISAGGVVSTVSPGGSVTIGVEGDALAVTTHPAGGSASGAASRFTTGSLTVRWSGGRDLPGPASLLTVASQTANAGTTARRTRSYRWGSLQLTPVARTDSDGAVRTRIEAVAVVNLHREYLRGVAEMPSSWPAAALQAQVVAARNYALAGYAGGTSSTCGGCHLWDDTRSQVYTGWAKESEVIGGTRYGDRWVAAVAATQTAAGRGLAVLYRGSVVTAYFSSSSGGRTRDSASAWGTAVPYLRSVPDPWSVDPSVNPGYAHWSRTVPVSRLLSLFGLRDLASVAVTQRDASGAAVTVVARDSAGTVRTVTGASFRSRLGLPAPWVSSVTLPTTTPDAGEAAGPTGSGGSGSLTSTGSATGPGCGAALPRPTITRAGSLCPARS